MHDGSEFIVTRPAQLCSGGREPIATGAVAYEDADGWVHCAAHAAAAGLIPVWVRTCTHAGCVITADHTHGAGR